MYSREEYQQVKKEVVKQRKAYDENSVDKSREKWLDARERRQDLEASRANIDAIYEARQMESDAEKELEDAIHHAGHLAAAKQHREHTEQAEKASRAQQEKEQAQYAKEEEEKTKAEMLQRWLASGGTSHQFFQQWGDMWRNILAERTMTGHDAMAERMAQRYAGVQI